MKEYHICTRSYQGVRNVSFSEGLKYVLIEKPQTFVKTLLDFAFK